MARNDHSGYPLKWFKDQNATRNAYECAICLEVLKDPVQVRDCGHQFCALCIDDILKTDPRCPTCRIEISDVMIFADHAARRLIKQLVVNCCNEGCSWQGCLSSLLQGHQNNCNFSIHRGNNVDQKVEKLEQTLETLVLKISTLEKKYEEDSKELKLKFEQDSKELKLKHEQDIKEVKLKLEQSEIRWQLLEEKQRELCEKEKKTALKQDRWQRPKEKENTAELYRNVMAILNKLTPQKFKTLMEQFLALNIDTPERLEGVIDRIFEKAVAEPRFSVAYANLCPCLFVIKVADAEGKDVSLRNLLLNRCQKEFETQNEYEQALLEKQKQFKGLSGKERKIRKEEIDEALAKNKRRMLGIIKFLGELFKLKLLPENFMHECVFKLLRAGDEESLESMCKLLFTIGEDLDSDRAKPRMDQYFDQINRIIIAEKVSSRVIFMLRDVVELRQNKWVLRREEHYNPKTIDQIHKEAQIEKMQEQRLAVQFPVKNKKQKQGGPGGRDSLNGTSNDGWFTTGKSAKSVLIDQNKLWNMAKRLHMDEISRSRNFSQEQDQPQGNSGGDMPSNRSYDPRTSSTGARPPLLGLWPGSDESRIKSDKDRENALEEFVEDMDMEGESGDEIKVERENYTETAAPVKQSRRKYERDFLLQFQYMPVCLTKPAGLPDIEIVLDAPPPPSKGGGSQRGGSDFSSFAFPRQKKPGRRGKRQPPTIIAADPLLAPIRPGNQEVKVSMTEELLLASSRPGNQEVKGPYGQPMMRPASIPNVQQAYQMQATSGFQPQYLQQQPPYFNHEMRPAMSYAARPRLNNQQIQQQQQPWWNTDFFKS